MPSTKMLFKSLFFIWLFSITSFAYSTERAVVYHISDESQAIPAIRNITNHLKADKTIHIQVIALSGGIRFLLDGAKDERGNDYAALIDGLMLDGVEFRVCANTLEAMSYTADDLSFGVGTVPSGIAEITRLQLDEGYAYVKP